MDLKPEEVFAACEKLQAEGVPVTGYAFRQRLDRGSSTTSQKYTEIWKRRQRGMVKITTIEAAIEMVSQTLKAYAESSETSSTAAMLAKDKEHSQIVSDLQIRLAEAEASTKITLGLVDKQSTETLELRARCNKLEKKQSRHDGIVHALQSELDDAKRGLRASATSRHIPGLS